MEDALSNERKVTPPDVAVTVERGGLAADDEKTARIAHAVAPPVRNFDCPGLRLPMTEEPAGWTQRATAGARK
jgi:hypothetical protein